MHSVLNSCENYYILPEGSCVDREATTLTNNIHETMPANKIPVGSV